MKTVFIKETSVCESLIHKLLIRPPAVVSLMVTLGFNDEVVLLQIGLEDGQVYVFDIKQNGQLIVDGQVWRLLQTPDVVKVMHDGGPGVLALHREFATCVRSIYDTQVACGLAMEAREVPSRRLSLVQIYHRFGDPGQRHDKYLKVWAGTTSMAWSQRPMGRQLVDTAAVAARCILPSIYQKMQDMLAGHKIQMPLYDSSSGQSIFMKRQQSYVNN